LLAENRSVSACDDPRELRKTYRPNDDTRRPDCLAEHVGLELRNVVANYPFERSHRFPGIQPNSGHRDYSRLSCGAGGTQLGPAASIPRASRSETRLIDFKEGAHQGGRGYFLDREAERLGITLPALSTMHTLVSFTETSNPT
jgi:hypothetical protein